MKSTLRLFDKIRFRYFKKGHRRLDLESIVKKGSGTFITASTSEHFAFKFKTKNANKELWIDDDGRISMD